MRLAEKRPSAEESVSLEIPTIDGDEKKKAKQKPPAVIATAAPEPEREKTPPPEKPKQKPSVVIAEPGARMPELILWAT